MKSIILVAALGLSQNEAATVHLPTPLDDCNYHVTVQALPTPYAICAFDILSRPDEDATLVLMRGTDGRLRPELVREPVIVEPVRR